MKTIKKYKGILLHYLLSGFIKLYSDKEKRYLKFDTLQGAKDYINNELKTIY